MSLVSTSLAEGVEDIHHLRELLQLGMGHVVDGWGIDWWDVLFLMIESELRQFMLMSRLAGELRVRLRTLRQPRHAAGFRAAGIERSPASHLARNFRPVIHWARHYRDVLSQLDSAQITQAFQDRFDREHRVRRRFAKVRRASRHPVVLLPSAYVNVSAPRCRMRPCFQTKNSCWSMPGRVRN